MNTHPTTEKTVFTLVREFDAPQKLVFNAFSTADALSEWWGPAESRNSVINLDFRPGGIFHFQDGFQRADILWTFLIRKN